MPEWINLRTSPLKAESTLTRVILDPTDHNLPTCSVYRTTNQTISNGTEQTLTFNAERFDPYDMHSMSVNTSRITIAVPGIYLLTAAVQFIFNGTGSRWCSIFKNRATANNRLAIDQRAPIGGPSFAMAATAKLAEGDYVEVVMFQDSGGNLDVYSASANEYTPTFSATYLCSGS